MKLRSISVGSEVPVSSELSSSSPAARACALAGLGATHPAAGRTAHMTVAHARVPASAALAGKQQAAAQTPADPCSAADGGRPHLQSLDLLQGCPVALLQGGQLPRSQHLGVWPKQGSRSLALLRQRALERCHLGCAAAGRPSGLLCLQARLGCLRMPTSACGSGRPDDQYACFLLLHAACAGQCVIPRSATGQRRPPQR